MQPCDEEPSPESPPDQAPDQAPDQQPELVPFYTSCLDRIPGSTSNRGYRAVLQAIGGVVLVELGRRYVILSGQMVCRDVDELMGSIHDQLKIMCADPLMIWAGGDLYWLGAGDAPYVCSNVEHEVVRGD